MRNDGVDIYKTKDKQYYVGKTEVVNGFNIPLMQKTAEIILSTSIMPAIPLQKSD
jgi:hypothetical protein